MSTKINLNSQLMATVIYFTEQKNTKWHTINQRNNQPLALNKIWGSHRLDSQAQMHA